jgi:hypothetical protein
MNRLLSIVGIALMLSASTSYAQSVAFKVTLGAAPSVNWDGATPFVLVDGAENFRIYQRTHDDKTMLQIGVQYMEIENISTERDTVRLPRRITITSGCTLVVGEVCAREREDGAPLYTIERIR